MTTDWMESIRKGDIFLVDFKKNEGSEQNRVRPAIIVQNDTGNAFSPTTIVCPLASRQKGMDVTHVLLAPEDCGILQAHQGKLYLRCSVMHDLKDELSELSEDKDNIHLEMSKYVGEEWELPEPPPLMSAKTYRTKIAQPLITKLKDVIRKLIVNVVEISKMWKQALNEKSRFAGRCRDLERENDSLRKDAKKFGIVRDKLGEDEVQSILQKAEEERLAKEIMKQPSAVGGKTQVRGKTRGNR